MSKKGLKSLVKKSQISKMYFYYSSFIFNKFVNSFMKKGKKAVSLKLIILLFKLVKQQLNISPLLFLHIIIKKASMPIELFSLKKSGRSYQLGKAVFLPRQLKKSIKLWGSLSFQNKKMSSYLYLYQQFLAFLENSNKSEILMKADEIYRIAIENQTYSHFRWQYFRRRKKVVLRFPLKQKINIYKKSKISLTSTVDKVQKFMELQKQIQEQKGNIKKFNLKSGKHKKFKLPDFGPRHHIKYGTFDINTFTLKKKDKIHRVEYYKNKKDYLAKFPEIKQDIKNVLQQHSLSIKNLKLIPDNKRKIQPKKNQFKKGI